VFLGRSFGKHAPLWEVSPGEASDNAGDLFDMALKIGKEKREGKNTSELQAEYEQKVKNFEETGSLISSEESQFYADELFDMAMKVGREKREGKDTSKQEAEYEQKLKNLEEISNSNKSNW
jgi:dsRNA-specific ribonuclease